MMDQSALLARTGLVLAAVACLAAAMPAGHPVRAGTEERPNILWLVAEDLSPWMPMYGDKTVATPHLQALARDGVVFRHCYASAPVCSPSRSALITGCWQTRLGVHQHRSSRTPQTAIHLPDPVAPLPLLFRRAGYFTYNHGKDDFNFVYDHAALYADGHEPKSYGFYGLHGYGDWTERPAGQPFFGQIMLLGGKLKTRPPDRLDPARVTVPTYYPDTPEFRDAIASHYDDIRLTDQQVGQIIDRLKADGLYDKTIIVFFADHGCDLPRHKSLLYDGGVHVPLIIAWPGNPAPLGGAGKVRRDLCSLIDLAATTLALAGLEVPRWMDSRNLFDPHFHRDFLPFARDRCDWTPNRIRAVRTERYKYIRNYHTDRPALAVNDYRAGQPVQKVLRKMFAAGQLTEAQSLVLRPHPPAEELYDLLNDPHETRNLATDPAYAEALGQMRRTLDRWLAETDDKGRLPESPAQYRVLLKRWGKRCIAPEFDAYRQAGSPPAR